MEYRFTRSSRRHRVGRGSARAALVDAGEPVLLEDGKLLWIGTDERGRQPEIVGVPVEDRDLVLITHVMPTALRMRR
ncbi:hypothetical protein [Acidipropionibacterium acidipropionici]|uniref:hypothetical protein n=1 Tax=Acidipropionibacterium acidipropionici TaxID=1748 RepID=UPI000301B658|nr:hypothetical protein [Acidipropionibacterium acidipropionici]